RREGRPAIRVAGAEGRGASAPQDRGARRKDRGPQGRSRKTGDNALGRGSDAGSRRVARPRGEEGGEEGGARRPGRGVGRTLGRGGPRLRGAGTMSGPAASGTAAIIAIGTEMLSHLRQDTNSLWRTERLEEVGITVVRKSIVPDDPEAIGDEISFSARAASLIFTTGGLGPTADDVTVPAVARRLGLTLARNEEYLAKMREGFARRGVRVLATDATQAGFGVEAKGVGNPRRTAPGLWIEADGRRRAV